jgi:hypothetical protein
MPQEGGASGLASRLFMFIHAIEGHHQNSREAVYLVHLLFSAHLLHFRKQVEGLSVMLLLDVATQCQELFHGLGSGKDVSFKVGFHEVTMRES